MARVMVGHAGAEASLVQPLVVVQTFGVVQASVVVFLVVVQALVVVFQAGSVQALVVVVHAFVVVFAFVVVLTGGGFGSVSDGLAEVVGFGRLTVGQGRPVLGFQVGRPVGSPIGGPVGLGPDGWTVGQAGDATNISKDT
jgi:hypothetical protein